jgi:hypothetical protein
MLRRCTFEMCMAQTANSLYAGKWRVELSECLSKTKNSLVDGDARIDSTSQRQ